MRLSITLLSFFQFAFSVALAQIDTVSCSYEIDITHGQVYTYADVPPFPEKGEAYLFAKIGRNLKVTSGTIDPTAIGCQLMVVEMIIDSSGKALACNTIQNPLKDKTFNERFFDIVEDVKWEPAKCQHKPVNFKMIMPVQIRIE